MLPCLEVDGQQDALDREPEATTSAVMTATLLRTGSRQRKTRPSFVAGQNSSSRPCIAGRPAPGTLTANMSPAETAKSAAVAQNAFVAPTTAIKQAADAGADEIRNAPDRLVHPVRALELQPGSTGRLGEHRLARRDPGGSKNAPITARTARSPKVSPTRALRIGIAATLSNESRSLTTETRRRPRMSTSVPERET